MLFHEINTTNSESHTNTTTTTSTSVCHIVSYKPFSNEMLNSFHNFAK